LKFWSVAGIHWEGDGARRRRFWPGGLAGALVAVADEEAPPPSRVTEWALLVDVLDGDEPDPSADGREAVRGRFPSLMLAAEVDGSDAFSMVEISGELGIDEVDPDVEDLLDGEGMLTGFKAQRFTCLFRLEATPKRRPQVSQTKAFSPV